MTTLTTGGKFLETVLFKSVLFGISFGYFVEKQRIHWAEIDKLAPICPSLSLVYYPSQKLIFHLLLSLHAVKLALVKVFRLM